MSEAAGNALISVYDKADIEQFAGGLEELNWHIYASGGTAKRIEAAGIGVTDVAELVGGEAILGHRVVTLSRKLHAGLLADQQKPEDAEELARLGIPLIGLACVDMYPLEEEIAKPRATKQDVLERTDVGGPTMLHSAAKGRRIVLSHPEQREEVLEWLRQGRPDEDAFLEMLAARAEYEVTRYTLASAKHLGGTSVAGFAARLHSEPKYGENAYQTAGFYADNRVDADPLGLDQAHLVQGMELSYNNYGDIERLLQTTTHIAAGFERNFGEVPPMAVGVKHGNACGAAVAETAAEAVEKMIEGDERAIFGGVVMVNGEITKEVAEVLIHHKMEDGQSRLLDGVVGASVTDEALELLSRKKLRVVINPALADLDEASLDTSRRLRYVRGGALEQTNYTFVQDLSAEHMEQHGEISEQQQKDMILAWAIGSTSNSNTITLVKDGKLIGNGVGQQDRVGAGQLALMRTTTAPPVVTEAGDKLVMQVMLDRKKLEGAVAYSDSFFPFTDGPELLARAGVKAILTSSGSVSDKEVVDSLTSAGVSVTMVPDKKGRGFMH